MKLSALPARLVERNELLSQRRVLELEQDIREAFWVEDEIRIEYEHYERLLREHGIDVKENSGGTG